MVQVTLTCAMNRILAALALAAAPNEGLRLEVGLAGPPAASPPAPALPGAPTALVAGRALRAGPQDGYFVIAEEGAAGELLERDHSLVDGPRPALRDHALRDPDVSSAPKTSLHVSKDRKSVVLQEWYGRMGNNVNQIMNAIFFGQLMNISKLRLPPNRTDRLPLFDLPDVIDIHPNADLSLTSCNLTVFKFFYGRCQGMRKGDLRSAMRIHLAPFLSHATKRACEAERRLDFRGLTIHLRSGDVQESAVKQGHFAPCSFFEKVVGDFGFHSVRLVTEPDRRHPCLSVLAQRLRGAVVSIQSKSIEADACAIMHAKHLAVGSWSSFSQMLELFGSALEDLFWPEPAARASLTLDNNCGSVPDIAADAAVTHVYKIQGMEKAFRAWKDKLRFILDTPLENVSEAQTCDQAQEVPWAGSAR